MKMNIVITAAGEVNMRLDRKHPVKGRDHRRVEFGRRRSGLAARIWEVIVTSGHGCALTYYGGGNIVVSPECRAVLDAMTDAEWSEIFALADRQKESHRALLRSKTRTERYADWDEEQGYSNDPDDPYYNIRATADDRIAARRWLADRDNELAWPVDWLSLTDDQRAARRPLIPECVARSLRCDYLCGRLWLHSPTWGDILRAQEKGESLAPGYDFTTAATELRETGHLYVTPKICALQKPLE